MMVQDDEGAHDKSAPGDDMVEETTAFEDSAPRTAGGRLRAAREARGMSLEQVADETRIPQRHLETIESGEFANLPARTYAVGFARTYAKTVGIDDKEIVEQVRQELGVEDPSERRAAREGKLEPGDPARVPSRGLVLLSALAAALLLSGGFLFYRTYFIAGSGPGSILTAEQQREEAAAELEERLATRADGGADAATVPTGGPVVFTALENDTWVKFYDANGDQLMQKQMAQGERYTVPADAEGPQIWTGRPFALSITVGGQSVPKLSEEDEILKDVPVSAEALLARGRAPAPDAGEATGTAEPDAPAG